MAVGQFKVVYSCATVLMRQKPRGLESFDADISIDLTDDSEDDINQGNSKSKLEDILKEYRQQWDQQKELAEDPHKRDEGVILDDSEIIDDVLAEVDSVNNTANTSILLEESFDRKISSDVKSHKKDIEYGQLKSSTPALLKTSPSPVIHNQPYKDPTAIKTTKQINKPMQTPDQDTDSIQLIETVGDISSVESVVSDTESQLTDQLLTETVCSPRGLSTQALYLDLVRKKLDDEDDKSDSGVSDSTLSKDSMEDLSLTTDITTTRVPKAVMKNITQLSRYNKSQIPIKPFEVLAYPVFDGNKYSKKTEVKTVKQKPMAVTFEVQTDPSVLEGQELVNQYAPTAVKDQLQDVIKVSKIHRPV